MTKLSTLFIALAFWGSMDPLLAQKPLVPGEVTIRTMTRARRSAIPDDAIIYDSTGRRMELAEFSKLNRADPLGHQLIPVYDEYGKVGHYSYRPVRQEDRDRGTGQRITRDPKLTPKPGQKMPSFVMQGLDGKTYRLADLAGKNVVLSFWVSFQPPFTPPGYLKTLADALKPYAQRSDLVALGITEDGADQIKGLLGTQEVPFVPVGDGHGFAQRYHIFTSPTLIIIDRAGTVIAKLDGVNANELGAALKKLK